MSNTTHSLEDYRVLVNGFDIFLRAESITHAWELIKYKEGITAVHILKQKRWVNVYTK